MIKQIKLKGSSLQIKCKCVAELCFGGCSDSELSTLSSILAFSSAGTITMTPSLTKQTASLAGISNTSLTTSLFRLEKKGMIVRSGKNINFHPVFNNLMGAEKLLISFIDEVKPDQDLGNPK